MASKTTVKVGREAVEVPAYEVAPGLVVNRSPFHQRWDITHTPTGRLVAWAMTTKAIAEAVAAEIAPYFDWTQEDPGFERPEQREALHRAVRVRMLLEAERQAGLKKPKAKKKNDTPDEYENFNRTMDEIHAKAQKRKKQRKRYAKRR